MEYEFLIKRTDKDIRKAVCLWLRDPQEAKEKYGPIEEWNTGLVTNMSSLFMYATKFDDDIGDWDTSNVTSMNSLFYGATKFNKSIGKWNTSSVKDMRRIFDQARCFNKELNAWDVSSVIDLSHAFHAASAFNQDLSKWRPYRCISMKAMFSQASSFNQSIGKWDISTVTTFDSMFSEASSFTQDLSEWGMRFDMPAKTSNTSMKGHQLNFSNMFSQCPTSFIAAWTEIEWLRRMREVRWVRRRSFAAVFHPYLQGFIVLYVPAPAGESTSTSVSAPDVNGECQNADMERMGGHRAIDRVLSIECLVRTISSYL